MSGPRFVAWRRAAARSFRLIAAGASIAAALWLSPLAELEDGPGLRFLYGLRGANPPPQDVVIVALDSTSSKALGVPERADRWPRSLHARLVAGLAASGAAVVGFDLLFNLPRDDADDLALRDALRRAGNVVLVEGIGREPLAAQDGRVVATTERRVLPLPLFADAVLATAPFVLPKTPDGVFEFWMVVPTAGDRPSLPLVLAERMLSRGAESAEPATIAADARPGPRLVAELARSPRRVLNLYGPLGTVTTIRYPKALELVSDPAEGAKVFGGKAVLVGYSEAIQSKQADMYRTPFSTADGVDVSGVELCATAVGNLLDRSWLRRPSDGESLLVVALFGALAALPWAVLRPRAALAAALALGGGYAAAAYGAFAHAFVWLPVLIPLGFALPAAGALGLASRYREARREGAELEKAIELGLPRRSVERLTAQLGDLTRGRTVYAVCLCSDIEGYTTLSETLSPEATRNVLDGYFSRFIPVVERHGGYAADMVGDCVMSVWIADSAPEVACRDACAAALELDRLMNARDAADALRTRFGLHCGRVFFGEIGPEGRHELRVIGDIVNSTSRIQSANKYLGTTVLASGEVAARLDVARRGLGSFGLAGKARAVELVQLFRDEPPSAAAHAFELGLEAFHAGDLRAAEAHFGEALAAGDAGPAAFYLDQCRRRAAAAREAQPTDVVALPGK